MSIVSATNVPAIGRLKISKTFPLNSMSERLKFPSTMEPSTSPSTSGAAGTPPFENKKPIIAQPSRKMKSKVELFTANVPTQQRNPTIGINISILRLITLLSVLAEVKPIIVNKKLDRIRMMKIEDTSLARLVNKVGPSVRP